MSEIRATFRVVTPMFLGEAVRPGESRPGTAEKIRPPSVKSAISFWWRALQWKTHLAQHPNDVPAALRALHRREEVLFGSAAREENRVQMGGQGRFLLTVVESSERNAPRLASPPSSAQQYLLGMGLYSFRDGLLREPTPVGEFTLRLRFKGDAPEAERREVGEALLLWGLLGGLGARSRKGYGSVAIQELHGVDGLQVPRNTEEFKNTLQALLKELPADLPQYTAFSRKSRIDISLIGKDPLVLLTDTGREMMLYRSYGRNGRVSNNPPGHRGEPVTKQAEKNFGPGKKYNDHDLALNAARGNAIKVHPARVVFGLPHNYRFSERANGRNLELKINARDSDRERRASPLFIHVHTFPGGESVVVQTLLPAQFLPEKDEIVLKPNSGKPNRVKPNVDWQVIHDYLDRFEKYKQRQVVLP